MDRKQLISVVLPVYNEEKNVSLVAEQLLGIAKQISNRYDMEIIFVDDGSRDNSFEELIRLCEQNSMLKALSFSRNFGHQIALTAGFDYAKGDAIICMDSDLQHPPELIPIMLKKWEEGNNIVYTIRKDNSNISFVKRYCDIFFYWLINKVSNTPINRNAADYRLISRIALDEFNKLRERDRFLRGMINWVGFKNTAIEYEVGKRIHGKSSYSMWKLVKFAANAVTSFSGAPLRTSFVAGSAIAGFAFIYGVYLVIQNLFFGAKFIPGWPSLIISVLFLGGVQLISVGILGEYIYRIFNEVKKRPLYIIDKTINVNKQ
ncbi:MAG: glycosyltransferase family 2 protein [Candidatus Moranbacteria bacterium]|nr:glycosyltransferase family 2 protein [Candidatus Moranbacteria bacterium]